jgi:peptide deformylase
LTRDPQGTGARLQILRYGDPRLEADNAPVTSFDEELSGLIEALFEAGWKAPGLGLAAPQVGVNLRLAVVDLSVGEDPSARMVIANPEIVRREGKVVLEEGCLSFPGLFTTISRPRRVWVRAQDGHGVWREIEADGLLAQALCHEVDHLDGVLLVHRLNGIKRRLFLRRVQKLRSLGAW